MNLKGLIRGLAGWRAKPVADATSDPNLFLTQLSVLPNPDPILRQLGQAERVYHSIMMDGHVLGDVRSIRGEFRSYKYRVVPGDEKDSASKAAAELCADWMRHTRPNKVVTDWLEVLWQMSSSILTGYRPHEMVWDYNAHGGKLARKTLPISIEDRPGRRFLFDVHGAPLLLSKDAPQGKPVEPYQFVISRHMPTTANPYGIALLSACYWPWVFKTGGWRYFVKFCERHGLPWPVARYPLGTQDNDIDKLSEAMAAMAEAGYVVVPDGTGVELLVPSSSGTMLPQESLINATNREMSKALTGQAMVAELHNVGARAASEVALRRQSSINDSDRDISSGGMSEVFRWITLFNFGEGVVPPELEFYRQEAASKDRAAAYQIVANLGARPSKAALLDEMDMPAAVDDADALLPISARAPAQPQEGRDPPDFSAFPGFSFARAAGMTEDEAVDLAAKAADDALQDGVLDPIYRMLVEFEEQGKSLADFRDALAPMLGQLDDEGLREVIDNALTYSILRGAATRVD